MIYRSLSVLIGSALLLSLSAHAQGQTVHGGIVQPAQPPVFTAPLPTLPIFPSPIRTSPILVPEPMPFPYGPGLDSPNLTPRTAVIRPVYEQPAALREKPQEPAPPAAETPATPPPTVLVFHDHHREEVQNYAIVGNTLWVYDGKKRTGIELSDLDIDATQKENRARGLRFSPPRNN